MSTTLSQRLEQAMEFGRVDRAKLIAACRVSPAAASKWFRKETKALKADHVFKIARLCHVSAEWLATGKGVAHPVEGVREPPPAEFEPKHVDLLRMYKRLPEELRLPIRQMIETLAAAQREKYSSWVAHEREAANG